MKNCLKAPVALLVAAPLAVGVLTGCNSNSGQAKAHAHAVASSTVVQGDEQAAAKLIQSCVTAGHVAAFKSCMKTKVPADKRSALEKCLANVAIADHLRWRIFKTDPRGNACVLTALKP